MILFSPKRFLQICLLFLAHPSLSGAAAVLPGFEDRSQPSREILDLEDDGSYLPVLLESYRPRDHKGNPIPNRNLRVLKGSHTTLTQGAIEYLVTWFPEIRILSLKLNFERFNRKIEHDDVPVAALQSLKHLKHLSDWNNADELSKYQLVTKKWALKYAQTGNLFAQGLLGELLLEENNLTQAVLWLKKAANRGHFRAAWLLSKNLTKKSEAQSWTFKSASWGYEPAITDLGLYYLNQGAYPEAVELFLKAVDRGSLMAKVYLAKMNALGLGLAQNKKLALIELNEVRDQLEIKPYHKLVDEDQITSTVYQERGRVYYLLGQYSKAVDSFLKCHGHPNMYLCSVGLGVILSSKNLERHSSFIISPQEFFREAMPYLPDGTDDFEKLLTQSGFGDEANNPQVVTLFSEAVVDYHMTQAGGPAKLHLKSDPSVLDDLMPEDSE